MPIPKPTATKNWEAVIRELMESSALPRLIHRVLLWGPPRTGKSSLPATLWGKDKVERLTLHKQQPIDDMLGGYTLQDGSTRWVDGPVTRAMRNGHTLVLDECDQFSPETRCALHAVLDDPGAITLANGERVEAAPGYIVIGTTNALPSTLPPALFDRWDLILKADTLSAGLREKLGNLANPAQATLPNASYSWTREVSVNMFLAIAKLRSGGMSDESIAEIFGLNARQTVDLLAVMAVAR